MSNAKAKQNAYRHVFQNELGKVVLCDLKRFCCGTRTTISKIDGKIDPLDVMIMEGRRQVLLQILTTLKIDIEEFFDYEEDLL